MSTFGSHPRLNLGHSKLKLSGKGKGKLKLNGNGNECKPLLKGSYQSRQKRAAEEAGLPFDAETAEPMPAMLKLACGGLAGVTAQSITYPLDIVRRRIQVVGKAGGYGVGWCMLTLSKPKLKAPRSKRLTLRYD